MKILPLIILAIFYVNSTQSLPKKTWKSQQEKEENSSPEVDGESSRKIIGQR